MGVCERNSPAEQLRPEGGTGAAPVPEQDPCTPGGLPPEQGCARSQQWPHGKPVPGKCYIFCKHSQFNWVGSSPWDSKALQCDYGPQMRLDDFQVVATWPGLRFVQFCRLLQVLKNAFTTPPSLPNSLTIINNSSFCLNLGAWISAWIINPKKIISKLENGTTPLIMYLSRVVLGKTIPDLQVFIYTKCLLLLLHSPNKAADFHILWFTD